MVVLAKLQVSGGSDGCGAKGKFAPGQNYW